MQFDYHGLMTRGVPSVPAGTLPLGDFPPNFKTTVLEACREAWRRLSAAAVTEKVPLVTLSEDEITSRLKTILNHLRREEPSAVPGFSDELFETVSRDAVVCTYDGSSLDKKPDLVFRPVKAEPGYWLSEYHALFAECKVVDGSGHPASLYCSKGLRRFVRGDYAWAVPSGLMIAYCRDGMAVVPALRDTLVRAQRRKSGDVYHTGSFPTVTNGVQTHPSAYFTVHGRPWTHINGDDPRAIEVVHLWLG